MEQLRREGWLKPGVPAWYNAGIYIFRPVIFEFTSRLQKSPRGEYELTDAISALIASQDKNWPGPQLKGPLQVDACAIRKLLAKDWKTGN